MSSEMNSGEAGVGGVGVGTSATSAEGVGAASTSVDAAPLGGVLTAIDHVGIVVDDLDGAVKFYEQSFGAQVVHRERVEHDGVEEVLLAAGDDFVQLLTPTREDSAVAKWLAKNGSGIHHVGYRVKDCQQALDMATAAGVRSLDQAPRPGSRGTTVAFLHPKTAWGTLIELVQEN